MLATILPAVDTSLPVTTAQVFWSEFLGTAVLLLLGAGVVATNLLPKSKGKGGGWLMINFGWGLAVFAGVYVAFRTGGHLNPAVTIAKVVAYLFDPSTTLNGVPADKAGAVLVTGSNVAVYIIAQFLGAFVGAVLCWLTFKKHFDEDCDPALKLGVFSTGPEIRSYAWNCVTEAIGTAVLVLWVFVSGHTETAIGPLGVALIIVVSTVLWIVSRKRRKDKPSPVEAPSELSGAEQITQTATMTDDEIDAGRTAALRKMLEERGHE